MASRAEIKGRVSMDSAGVEVGLSRARQSAQAFQTRIKSVGAGIAAAFTIGAITKFAAEVINLGSKLSDMAFATGLSAEEFQALSVAARNAGASEDQLTNSLSRLKTAQGRVIEGDKTMIEAFEKLGISQQDVINLDIPELFEAMAKGLTKSNNGALEFSAVSELIGQRNAPKLLEALNEVANEGLAGMTKKAKEGGQVMDDELIEKMDKAADAMQALKRGVQVAFASIIAKVYDGARAFAAFWKAVKDEGFAAAMEKASAGALTPDEAIEDEAKPDIKKIQREARIAAAEEFKAKEKAKADLKEKTKGATAGAGIETADALRAIGAGGVGIDMQRQNIMRDQLEAARRSVDLLEQMVAGTNRVADNTRDAGLI